jgi:hypothetical protein
VINNQVVEWDARIIENPTLQDKEKTKNELYNQKSRKLHNIDRKDDEQIDVVDWRDTTRPKEADDIHNARYPDEAQGART